MVEVWRYNNSSGILDNVKYWNTPILIVWIWGIWWTLAVILAKMGMENITVVDYDRCENHNIQSQIYREKDIGKYKTDALKEICLEQSGIEIKTINSKYEPHMSDWMEVVCTLVDNNDVRKEIVDSLNGVPHIIDARMTWIFFQVYNMSSAEREDYYSDRRFPQSEATEVICSEKSSCFNCFISSWFVAATIRSRLSWHDIPSFVEVDMNLYLLNQTY